MVTGYPIKSILKPPFFDRVPRATQKAFLKCTELNFLKQSPWYLAGGTALALQVGHRQSVDLDFFIPQPQFSETSIERILFSTQLWKTTFREQGTIYGILRNARVSFIAYPFFKPSGDWLQCGAIRVLKPDDIAAMKIVAISQRGRKRDFVDLYWYCHFYKNKTSGQNFLKEVILKTLDQYVGQKENLPHILKSLTYFEDAEADPLPRLHFKATWRQIKMYFRKEVPALTKEMLAIPIHQNVRQLAKF